MLLTHQARLPEIQCKNLTKHLIKNKPCFSRIVQVRSLSNKGKHLVITRFCRTRSGNYNRNSSSNNKNNSNRPYSNSRLTLTSKASSNIRICSQMFNKQPRRLPSNRSKSNVIKVLLTYQARLLKILFKNQANHRTKNKRCNSKQ